MGPRIVHLTSFCLQNSQCGVTARFSLIGVFLQVYRVIWIAVDQ